MRRLNQLAWIRHGNSEGNHETNSEPVIRRTVLNWFWTGTSFDKYQITGWSISESTLNSLQVGPIGRCPLRLKKFQALLSHWSHSRYFLSSLKVLAGAILYAQWFFPNKSKRRGKTRRANFSQKTTNSVAITYFLHFLVIILISSRWTLVLEVQKGWPPHFYSFFYSESGLWFSSHKPSQGSKFEVLVYLAWSQRPLQKLYNI